MIDSLLLIGGNILGLNLYHNNKKKKQKQTLLRKKSQQDIKVDDPKEKTEEEKQADRYLGANITSLALFAISSIYPVARLPGIALAVYSALPIYKRATMSAIKEKKLKNDVLNSLVVTGSLASGHYIISSLFTFISNLGTVVVLKSKSYSEEMLKGVFDQKVSTVWLLRDNVEIETPIEKVQIDDIIIIHTGGLVPLDGVIVRGEVTVDQHTLTGESIPVEKMVDDKVLASTVVIAGSARVKVTQTGQNTVVAKIESVLQNTSDFKTGIQLKGELWADKVATPILIAGVAVMPLSGIGLATAIFNCSPGNGIRLSASAQTLTHIILAAQKNILIKDGRVLEQLMDVDTVVFDKTGTLTKDEHEVSRILSANNDYTEDDILFYAAATEQRVNHPLAQAIIIKAAEHEFTMPDLSLADHKYQVGLGVTANINNKTIQVGSLKFMQQADISLPDEIKAEVQQAIAGGFSVVMVAAEGQVVGAIEIQAQLRPEARQIIKDLRQRGVKNLYILSGDQLEPTRQMANLLELDGYFHNVSPEDKSNIIEKLQKEGKKVCFIGDGINDVIAMKKANVSISLSGASTIATDVAQVIFMNGTLSELDELFALSHLLKRRLVMTITSYTTVVLISFSSIAFLGTPPFITLIVQSFINNTYGMTQALFPIIRLRNKKKLEFEEDKEKLLEIN
jgi:Cu2+-exporting ATPase